MQKVRPLTPNTFSAEIPGSENLEVSYRITCRDFAADVPHRGYGIEAILMRNGERMDACTVDDVTCSLSKAEDIVELLLRNVVTPVTLRDVLEDIVSG